MNNDEQEKSKWFEFNDRHVRQFPLERMAEECYGGKYVTKTPVEKPPPPPPLPEWNEDEYKSNNDMNSYDSPSPAIKFIEQEHVRSNSAYLLIYDRVDVLDDAVAKEDGNHDEDYSDEEPVHVATKWLTTSTAGNATGNVGKKKRTKNKGGCSNDVLRSVWSQNMTFLRQQHLYDPAMGCRRYIWNTARSVLSSSSLSSSSLASSETNKNILVITQMVSKYLIGVINEISDFLYASVIIILPNEPIIPIDISNKQSLKSGIFQLKGSKNKLTNVNPAV